MSLNGLSLNGLSLNGLSLNGLSLNGLSTLEFNAWFRADPVHGNQLMKYLVLCALPEGQSLTWQDALTGGSFTWHGRLGLTPDWAGGAPATVLEQRLITSCLAAHANKYGRNVSLSLLGRDSRGVPIPYTSSELSLYGEKEACFFGNLFTQEGLFAGNDGRTLNDKESTARACALSTLKNVVSQECAPILRVADDCSKFCTPDSGGPFYKSCTYNGTTYPVLTTRLRREDIYFCGDGVCQHTERCGTGDTFDSCGRDCGPCL